MRSLPGMEKNIVAVARAPERAAAAQVSPTEPCPVPPELPPFKKHKAASTTPHTQVAESRSAEPRPAGGATAPGTLPSTPDCPAPPPSVAVAWQQANAAGSSMQ